MGNSHKKTALDKEAEDFIKNFPKGTYKKTMSSVVKKTAKKQTRVPRRLYRK